MVNEGIEAMHDLVFLGENYIFYMSGPPEGFKCRVEDVNRRLFNAFQAVNFTLGGNCGSTHNLLSSVCVCGGVFSMGP